MADSTRSLGSVAIVGAGASGLAAAYRLKREGVAVTVFEAEAAVGGKIRSFTEDGFTWEKGPNTMAENEDRVSSLIDDLGLRNKQQLPIQQNKRYVVRNGAALPLPSNPIGFITTKLFSPKAKLRVLMEPFLWKRRAAEASDDESVGSFMERHFGPEVVDYAMDPFVAGTTGSDPASLSVRHAFPSLWELEKNHGSLLIGAIKSGFSRKKRSSKSRVRGSFSFSGGLQSLANGMMSKIGEKHFKLDSAVSELWCNQQGNPCRSSWMIRCTSQKGQEHYYDAVIMTAPLHDLKNVNIVKDGRPYALDFLPKVIYEPLSVCITLFKKDSVKSPLDGFGVLIPSKEQENGFRSLGTLFSSSMFPDRAPPDHVLFTTFVGGSRNMKLASCSREELLEIVCKDLAKLLGVEERPVNTRHEYWEKAFPRYAAGYDSVLSSMEKLEQDLPGLYYAGNHRGGLAVGKAIISGQEAAERALKYLISSGGRRIETMV